MGTITINTHDLTRALLTVTDRENYYVEREPDRSYTVIFNEPRPVYVLSFDSLEYPKLVAKYQLDPEQAVQLYGPGQLFGLTPRDVRLIISPHVNWNEPRWFALKNMLDQCGFKNIYDRGVIRG